MIDKDFAQKFAAEWIASWNSHDLGRILSHYADDVEMTSPLVIQVAGEPSGRLKGKKDVGAYWEKALKLVPNLKFDLISVLTGVESVTLYYYSKGTKGRVAAEVLHFGSDGKVVKAFAHYVM